MPTAPPKSSAIVDFADSATPMRFSQFERVIQTHRLAEVCDCLDAVEAAVAEGFHAVGFVAYEAAPAFDAALQTHPPDPRLPLLWFGLLRTPQPLVETGATAPELNLSATLAAPEYGERFQRIQRHIRDGDTYQINFSFPLRGEMLGAPETLFHALRDPGRRGYHACIETQEWSIVSASPELFVSRQGCELLTRPMKGTRARGRTTAEDDTLACELRNSAKDRAENVMIVDLLRNDLGRLARPGAVSAGPLFEVERHPGVLQMTSTVRAETLEPPRLRTLFGALFPCGSVTGAPKVKTMGIIAGLEAGARGVYCGTVGWIRPNGNATFNVAIRSFTRFPDGGLVYPVGSGLVADSAADAEYAECLLKAERASRPLPDFELLETLLWRPEGGYWLLDRHLERLANSAEYWGYPLDLGDLRRQVLAVAPAEQSRVRLLLSALGTLSVEKVPMPEIGSIRSLRLLKGSVHSRDPLLFHKTTAREVYTQAFAQRGEADDCLLVNERDEITEATRANVAMKLDGEWLTPAVDCGLLAGTLRAEMLAAGELREAVIRVADLERAEGVRAFNSVRGVHDCEVVVF
jgi:para-aminobenzoate synthetase/4-amino-4-deoxychorismate lyase